MKLKNIFARTFIFTGLLAPAVSFSEDSLKWSAYSTFSDGRKFYTDGALLLDSRYTLGEPLPQKSLPEEGVQRLLKAETDHEFGAGDLTKKDANYIAPVSIQLNERQIYRLS
jgi:hypothetical protein